MAGIASGDLAGRAEARLRERGEREAQSLRETLEAQRHRVEHELAKHEKHDPQLTLGFSEEERRQLNEHAKAWRGRLEQFGRDLATEPKRVAEFYQVRARRIEPVGLVYLWPETN